MSFYVTLKSQVKIFFWPGRVRKGVKRLRKKHPPPSFKEIKISVWGGEVVICAQSPKHGIVPSFSYLLLKPTFFASSIPSPSMYSNNGYCGS